MRWLRRMLLSVRQIQSSVLTHGLGSPFRVRAILLKIRQVVPTAGSALPVQIAVPANSTVSTVGADTCCSVTGVNVVNPINVAVTGAAMVNGTERLLYFNKVRGVLRLMDCCVPVAAAQASEVKAGK